MEWVGVDFAVKPVFGLALPQVIEVGVGSALILVFGLDLAVTAWSDGSFEIQVVVSWADQMVDHSDANPLSRFVMTHPSGFVLTQVVRLLFPEP